MDYPFPLVRGRVVPGPTRYPSAAQHPSGYPSPKTAPNDTPFFSSYPGKLGRGARNPLPSLLPPARRNPAALPGVRRAGSIRDVLMMNVSSWNCGSVSQA